MNNNNNYIRGQRIQNWPLDDNWLIDNEELDKILFPFLVKLPFNIKNGIYVSSAINKYVLKGGNQNGN